MTPAKYSLDVKRDLVFDTATDKPLTYAQISNNSFRTSENVASIEIRGLPKGSNTRRMRPFDNSFYGLTNELTDEFAEIVNELLEDVCTLTLMGIGCGAEARIGLAKDRRTTSLRQLKIVDSSILFNGQNYPNIKDLYCTLHQLQTMFGNNTEIEQLFVYNYANSMETIHTLADVASKNFHLTSIVAIFDNEIARESAIGLTENLIQELFALEREFDRLVMAISTSDRIYAYDRNENLLQVEYVRLANMCKYHYKHLRINILEHQDDLSIIDGLLKSRANEGMHVTRLSFTLNPEYWINESFNEMLENLSITIKSKSNHVIETIERTRTTVRLLVEGKRFVHYIRQGVRTIHITFATTDEDVINTFMLQISQTISLEELNMNSSSRFSVDMTVYFDKLNLTMLKKLRLNSLIADLLLNYPAWLDLRYLEHIFVCNDYTLDDNAVITDLVKELINDRSKTLNEASDWECEVNELFSRVEITRQLAPTEAAEETGDMLVIHFSEKDTAQGDVVNDGCE